MYNDVFQLNNLVLVPDVVNRWWSGGSGALAYRAWRMSRAWHISSMNSIELSEKLNANRARDSVECSAPFLGANAGSRGVVPAVLGVGRASSSTSSFATAVRGALSSEDRSCRSWYRLCSRYFRTA